AADADLGPHQTDRISELVQPAAQQPVGQIRRAARALNHLPLWIAHQHFAVPQPRVTGDVVELEAPWLDLRGIDADAVDVDLDFSSDRRRTDEAGGRRGDEAGIHRIGAVEADTAALHRLTQRAGRCALVAHDETGTLFLTIEGR